MKSSKRDFQAIALLIHSARGQWFDDVEGFYLFVDQMAYILQRSNPAFERAQFRAWCLFGSGT
jgi:hypothetical protein